MQHDKEIDTRGRDCPLSVLRTRLAARGESGGELTFLMKKT